MKVVLNSIFQIGTGEAYHWSYGEGKSETGSWRNEGKANLSLTCLDFFIVAQKQRIHGADAYVWYANIYYNRHMYLYSFVISGENWIFLTEIDILPWIC